MRCTRSLPTYLISVIVVFALISLSVSCNPSGKKLDQKEGQDILASDTINSFVPAYALFTSKEGKNKFIFIDSGWTHISTAPIPHADFNREYILRKGYLYQVNPKTDYLVQYRIHSDGLQALDSIRLVNDNIEQYHWKNNSDTLLLCNVVHQGQESARLYEIDTKNFSLLREVELPVPHAVNDFDILSLGFLQYRNDMLWTAYAYSKMLGHTAYTTVDTMYYRTLDFSSLRVLSEEKDTRSAYPGGINTIQSYSGLAENGDFYFMSGPGIAAGNTIHLPTAIFRRKHGAEKVDRQYMINVSKQISNHAYGFWYIGNNRALVRSEQADKYADFSNHHLVHQFDYFLTDLHTGKMEKLPLPLDKGTRKENMIHQGDHLYIAIDDAEDRHSIWRYNLNSKEATRFLTPKFPIDYLLRLDQVQ
ncbi:hypothetical protein [Sphingobacterium deserti]|uniref:Lipoprotein n=1 Tax=Sphingobacterium deserti TaxID=1229276 RepID=A0A0B8T6K9_9SPHI|nr:hypothetical protein [Sphingobacterium deserti]KGE12940.1 hypothetical protein DI53_3377 [Sphingobacterium deserti]